MPPTTPRRTAVIGGGINGIMTAWRLAALGHQVELFERGALMQETSRASTKLLHGGVRYLEQRNFPLVREALRERTWWVREAPQYAHPLRLVLPIYEDTPRPRWIVGMGLTLYDLLAGGHGFGRHRWHRADELRREIPTLRADRLRGGYSFFDAQMDDYALGVWAANQARRSGVTVHEYAAVERVSTDGTVVVAGATHQYDRVVNVAGPWARALLDQSGVPARHQLDLVRGSHLLLSGTIAAGLLLQVPHEQRVCFVLPYQGQLLLGTTEVRQTLDDPIVCSDQERRYLLDVYNAYFTDTRTEGDISSTFAGVRPLIRSAENPTLESREYALERHGQLVTVFGGKWTTARVLARRAAALALRD